MSVAASFADILGRQDELCLLEQLLEADGVAALLIEGEAGIGKTTLWRAGLELARKHAFKVLSSSPTRGQRSFAYGALADLASGATERLDELPDPQRRALEQALLLAEHEGLRLEPRTVAVAFLGLLRLLADEVPLLVAVDDIQWLDRASAQALEYALPRLESPGFRVLLALRLEEAGSVRFEPASAFPAGQLRRLSVRGLSVGALQRLIHDRLGVSFIRPTLQRVHELTSGNPFFALEVSQALEARDAELAPGEPLPVPADIRELVRQRLRRLPAPSREALLATAMQRQPTVSTLEDALPGAEAALDKPLLAGIVELSGDRIRFAHPLFASGIYGLASPKRRRQLHSRLAGVVPDSEEQALHAALAAEGPDEAVAALLERAAGRARARGAGAVAAELYAHAVELTPVSEEEALRRRWVEQGECLMAGGDKETACTLLEELIERSEPGPERAWLRAMLLTWRSDDFPQMCASGRELLAEARADAGVCARIAIQLSAWECHTSDLRSALRTGQEALKYAEQSGDPTVLAYVLPALSRFEADAGLPAHEHLDLADRLVGDTQPPSPYHRPRFIAGCVAILEGRLAQGRALLEPIYEQLRASGEDYNLAGALPYLAQMEWWSGNWQRAAELAEEGRTLSTETRGPEPWLPFFVCALVSAGRGRAEKARETIREGARIVAASRAERGDSDFGEWLLGFIDLSLGDAHAAAGRLAELASSVEAYGYGNPGTVPLWGDAVESLVETGAIEQAEELTQHLERMAPKLEHPYRDALAARCRGLVASSGCEHERAIAELENSATRFESIGMPFERARSLLALGVAQRRAKKRAAARRSLTSASSLFKSLPAPLWQAKAEQEMERIGGRAPGGEGELTPSEERVARLVAQGLSNKEVAARLFVTVRTVEAALTRIYAKLEVRSRGELTVRLLSGAEQPR